MLDMASILLSIVALLISITTSFVSFFCNKKVRGKKTFDIKRAILNYNNSLHHLREKQGTSHYPLADLQAHLASVNGILVSLYPSAQFRISIKVIQATTDPSECVTRNIVCFNSGIQEEMQNAPIRIVDNTDFNAILNEGRDFFFVSDINEYDRLREYKNSDANFRCRWNSSLVFPIKKDLSSNSRHIIGFLCISSTSKLNNPKMNESIMKLFPNIADDLYIILDNLDLSKLTEENI